METLARGVEQGELSNCMPKQPLILFPFANILSMPLPYIQPQDRVDCSSIKIHRQAVKEQTSSNSVTTVKGLALYYIAQIFTHYVCYIQVVESYCHQPYNVMICTEYKTFTQHTPATACRPVVCLQEMSALFCG